MKNHPTEAQLQTLREGLQGYHLEAMLLLALVTGIRRDELRRLMWSEINLQTGEMHVLNTKTKNHVRRICLPENVVRVLSQHALSQEEQNRNADAARQDFDLVFPDGTGGELSIERFLQGWYVALEQAGLPRLCFHSLRVIVWRRLFAQRQADRERLNDTKDDAGKDFNGEEPHDE